MFMRAWAGIKIVYEGLVRIKIVYEDLVRIKIVYEDLVRIKIVYEDLVRTKVFCEFLVILVMGTPPLIRAVPPPHLLRGPSAPNPLHFVTYNLCSAE